MQQNQTQILVIGAGPAGIGAALTLHRKNVDYLVLEGRNRAGGRVYSQEIDGVQIDLGACWIHSYSKQHPLYKQVKRLGWKPCVLQKRTIGRKYLDSQTGSKYEKEIWQPGDQHYEQLYKEIKQQTKISKEDLSLHEAGKNYLEQFDKLSPLMQRYLTLIINMKEHYEGSSIKELSAKNYSYRTMFGRDYLPEKSYASLLKEISKGLNIRFKTFVKAIKYGEGVQVLTEDGTVIKAKKLIASLPLGLLKKNIIEFLPPLPQTHQEAIHRLGNGLMNKVIISFSKNFWGDCRWISIGSNQRGKFPHFYNLSRGQKYILCSFITDDFARKIQPFSDEEIIEQLLCHLRKTFPEKQIKIRSFRITRWGQDQYSLGSYSAFHVGSSCKDAFQLRKPIKDSLWLVGEHCFPQHLGTAGGAYQTGIWAAEQAIKQKDKKQKKEWKY